MILTKEIIQSEFSNLLNECFHCIPKEKWKHNVNEKIGFTSHKTKYGWAFKDGRVEINAKFVGTTAINALRHTIRHELAHLAVGLDEHHNRRFNLVADRFGCECVRPEDAKQVEQAISFKYSVYAHVEGGQRLYLGQCHRKTKLYDVPDGRKVTVELEGVKHKVIRFELLEN